MPSARAADRRDREDSAPPPKTIIGPYQVLETIGRGGQADTVLAAFIAGHGASWKAFGRDAPEEDAPKWLVGRVVLKILRRMLCGSESANHAISFHREARLGMDLQHPLIVPALDYGIWTEDFNGTRIDRPYIVQQWVDGLTLHVLIQELRRHTVAPLAVDLVRYIVVELLAILVSVQRVRWAGKVLSAVHGDIKPSNVMISRWGYPLLLDWGIGKYVQEPRKPGAENFAAGTPGWMAPERYLGAMEHTQWDLFSVGVIMHLMLTGEMPFPSASDALLACTRVPPMDRVVPEDLENLRVALLQPDPKRRVPNPSDALSILKSPYGSVGHLDLHKMVFQIRGEPRSHLTGMLEWEASTAVDPPARTPASACLRQSMRRAGTILSDDVRAQGGSTVVFDRRAAAVPVPRAKAALHYAADVVPEPAPVVVLPPLDPGDPAAPGRTVVAPEMPGSSYPGVVTTQELLVVGAPNEPPADEVSAEEAPTQPRRSESRA